MKLYTEEQVSKIIFKTKQWSNLSNDYLIATVTPIELPSDEDIYSVLRGKKMYDNDWEFIKGAIWIKEQILNQNK